jgi:peptide/nickel transport system permease protein
LTATKSEILFDESPKGPEGGQDLPPGIGIYALAWKRLLRNRVAMFFGFLFILLVVLCLLAPVYSQDIAHIGPNTENLTGQIRVGGKLEYVLSLQDIPIGPTWNIHHYFLGADESGRDLAVRLLYGGRASLEIGLVAMLITMFFGTVLGIISGYFRGVTDGLISRIMDIIWSYPAVLLGITLNTVIIVNGLGPLHSTTLLSTAVVVGFVYIPYIVRPVRAQVLTLREREFVDAARTLGYGRFRIMFSEILPNLVSTLIVFFALQLAQSIVLESALSYLHAGVQAPNASWGTLLSDGAGQISAAPHLVLAPGIMLIITVLAVNVFGDGLRHAFDPRAQLRRER